MDRVLGGRGDAALDADGDPYITLGGEEEDSEDEGFEIKPTDLLILAARNEDDVSNLEVWVYEEADDGGEANVYVHHDILLPAFPLCVCWLDCSPGGGSDRANMAAVGTMETGIEIWDLDVIDSVEPAATLGGEEKAAPADAGSSESADKKKKKKVRPCLRSCISLQMSYIIPVNSSHSVSLLVLCHSPMQKKSKSQRSSLKEGSHEDSVLGISWCQQYRNVLASASADKTVKVWDISRQVCEHTLTHHTSKVQAVAWNPAEAPVLLTGSFDRSACLVSRDASLGQQRNIIVEGGGSDGP